MVSTASAETMHTGRIHHSRHQLHYSALLETYHGAYYCALYSSPDHYSNKKCHIQLTQQSFSLRVLVIPTYLKLSHIKYLQAAPRSIRNRSSKFAANISKRGKVPAKKSTDEEEERKLNPYMVGMFMFLVFGSSLVQVMKLFQSKPAIPKDE